MKSFLSSWPIILVSAVLATIPWKMTAASNAPPSEVSATLQRIEEQLQEQTRRIDRLYRAFGPRLSELEEQAAALEAQEREDKALALQIIREVSDKRLSGIGANNPGAAEFGVLTSEGDVCLYDAKGGLGKRLHVPEGPITCLAFSPDGKALLAGTEARTLVIWDLANNSHSVLCTNLGEKVERVTWLGEDRIVWATQRIYWSNDGKPQDQDKPSGEVLDRATGQRLWQFRSLIRNDFQTLAGAAKGERLAVQEIPGQPRGAFLLDGKKGEVVHTCYDREHGSGPLSLEISPDSNLLAVGYAPYDIILWNARTGERERLLDGHRNWVVSLAFSADAKKLISGAGDSTARIWETNSGREIGRIRFPGESSYVEGVGLSPRGDVCFAVTRGLLRVAKVP